MEQTPTDNYQLDGLSRINILLGKNGCGKSTILREISNCIIDNTLIHYISPQRSGELNYDSGVENTMIKNDAWLSDIRKRNETNNFKQQTITQYRRLEKAVLRKFQSDTLQFKAAKPFSEYLEKINNLLDEIYIKEDADYFSLYKKYTEKKLTSDQISSGESELICLGIECLYFVFTLADKNGLLLLDEPDVHLHPDLQGRLTRFLLVLLDQNNKLQIIIASHSTAIIGALSFDPRASIAFIKSSSYHQICGGEKKKIKFYSILSEHNKILPVFGAHPLTSVYREHKLLLVEGEDEVRIWQQVCRSSRNHIKLYPVECGTKDEMKKYEKIANEILDAVYDQNAKIYSIRDGDGIDAQLIDERQIVRIRLSCYSSENCILSNDILNSLGVEWEGMKLKIDKWINDHNTEQERKDYQELNDFKHGGYNRKMFKIKNSRNLLVSLADTNKPWEVIVGQSIAKMLLDKETIDKSTNSLYDFLGVKLFNVLTEL